MSYIKNTRNFPIFPTFPTLPHISQEFSFLL